MCIKLFQMNDFTICDNEKVRLDSDVGTSLPTIGSREEPWFHVAGFVSVEREAHQDKKKSSSEPFSAARARKPLSLSVVG